MPLTGISLGGASAARWLEADPSSVDCLEVAAEGFFARPSPYLRWLAGRFPLILRATDLSIGTPGPLSPRALEALAATCDVTSPRFVVHPLGFSEAGEIQLHTHVPISLSPTALQTVAAHIRQLTEATRTPSLIEPIVTPLRVPGSMAEPEFLEALCRTAGCRLFIDVTTVLVVSRNDRYDARAWVRALPGDLIAAARISDDAAWDLLADVVSHARPEVLVLGVHERNDAELQLDVERLRRVGREARSESDIGQRGTRATPGHQQAVEGAVTAARAPIGTPVLHVPPQGAMTPGVPARTDHPDIAPGVALFVLDDEGVFFSASRRELSLFNPAATLAWLLLEDGLAVPELTRAYQDALGVEASDAARHVGTILQRWFGLGHLSQPALLPGDALPLTTALAMLLTNSPLRAQFRISAAGVAAALGVAHDDVDTLTALDPDELDAQAEEVTTRKALAAGTRGTAGTTVAPRGVRGSAAIEGLTAARHYRLLTTSFAIRVSGDGLSTASPAAVLRARVHDALAHLECADVPEPDVTLALRLSSQGGWTVFEDNEPLSECRGPEDVVPAMKLALREIAVNRHPFLMSVHAGVVSFGDGCVLLPASAGSGKTTLTAALIRAGATYFSDEIALLEEGTLAVRPVPLALTIKEGSVDPLRALYPEIDALTAHVREDYVQVRYLTPPRGSLPLSDEPQPVRWIVFPRYAVNAHTELHPLSRPAALRRLLDESYIDLDRLDREKVEALVQWMRTVECFDLPLSSLDEAVLLLRELMKRPLVG